jgi:hypothetical protein
MNSETVCTKARANKVARTFLSVGESSFHAIVRPVRALPKPPPARHACNPLALSTPCDHGASPPRGETPAVGLRSLEFWVCRRRYPQMRQVAM